MKDAVETSANARPMSTLSPDSLKASLARRNWSVSNLAFRWRLTLSQLSRILHDPGRAPHYEDAFRGLPALTRAEARALTLLRLKSLPQKRRTRSTRPRTTIDVIHEAGDLFMSTDLVDQGEGYLYELVEPVRVPAGYEGEVVLLGVDGGDEFRIPYVDLLVLFTETGRKND